jgi:hypothetical protein
MNVDHFPRETTDFPKACDVKVQPPLCRVPLCCWRFPSCRKIITGGTVDVLGSSENGCVGDYAMTKCMTNCGTPCQPVQWTLTFSIHGMLSNQVNIDDYLCRVLTTLATPCSQLFIEGLINVCLFMFTFTLQS